MRKTAILTVLMLLALASPAVAATCPAHPFTLTNGATADATQVMADFNNLLTCANTSLAPLASPSLTGVVGIGTTTPALSLDIIGSPGLPASSGTAQNGAVRLEATANNVLDFGVTNVSPFGTWLQVTDRTNLSLTYPLLLQPNGGNVGIGTSAPAQALHVVGTIRQTHCITAGTLSANTSGDINCTSDGRLKNILGDYAGGMDALLRITPKLFTYKTTPSDPVETFVHAGFIAQNVMAVIPQASARQLDGYYSLDTTAILAASVNAIKQLKSLSDEQAIRIARQADEIATLTSRLAKMDARMEALEGRIQARAMASGMRRVAGNVKP